MMTIVTAISGAVGWSGNGGGSSRRYLIDEYCPPVSRLVLSYILLVPMVVFAVHGGFSFQHAAWNSDIGAMGGRFAVASTSAETLQERVQSWVALMLCVAAVMPYADRVTNVAMQTPLMLALPLYAISSAFWSQDGSLSLRSGLSLLVTTLFAFYLASRFTDEQQMELVLLTGGCVVAMSVALAVFWPQFGIDHQLHEGAWQGLFTQKNVCAEVTVFLLTPALALPSRGRYGQILRAFYVLLCLLVIAMTQSRTGWAITAVYLAFVASLRLLGKLERKDLLPVAALCFAILGGLIAVSVQYSSLLLTLFSRSGDMSGRSQIWSAILSSILRHPVGGYGFDAFWSLLHGEASSIFAATGWVVTSAHSGFLNVGLELGLVGLVLVAATFVQAFRNASTAFYPGRSSYVDWCIGIVFLTLIYNLDERTLMATQYLPWILYIMACTGLATAARNRRMLVEDLPVSEDLP